MGTPEDKTRTEEDQNVLQVDADMIQRIYRRVYNDLEGRVAQMFDRQFLQRLETIVDEKLSEMGINSTILNASTLDVTNHISNYDSIIEEKLQAWPLQ